MHVIINIQSFICVNLLRKAKFLLATQGIFRLPSHGTNHGALADQQHKKKKWRRQCSIDQNNQALVIFFFQGR